MFEGEKGLVVPWQPLASDTEDVIPVRGGMNRKRVVMETNILYVLMKHLRKVVTYGLLTDDEKKKKKSSNLSFTCCLCNVSPTLLLTES